MTRTLGLLGPQHSVAMAFFTNLPRTAILGAVNAVALFLCARIVVPLFFVPSLAAMLGSYLLEPMFKPYMNDENAAD